ncbi:MAG: Spy/CpxP family protein refolding chaperone [Prolixibacteraceae bacterium]
MNNTKRAIRKTTLFILGVALTTTLAMAQPGHENRPPEPPDSARIQEMLKHLDSELDLNSEQKTKIDALFIAHFEQVKIQREKEKPQMEQMKADHENLRREFESSVKAQLSPEQAKQFDELNEKRMHENQDRGKKHKKGKDRPRK